MAVILGIDPGSNILGFACIENKSNKFDCKIIDIGTINLKKNNKFHDKILYLHEIVFKLCNDLNPSFCVLEKSFQGINISSSIKLGEIRGSIIAAIKRSKTKIFEITPAEAKKVITGNGRSNKHEVNMILTNILKLKNKSLPTDASDALSIALAGSYIYKTDIDIVRKANFIHSL